MPEVSDENVQNYKRDPLANIFKLEPFVSHGEEIIKDFTERNLSLGDLVLKYGDKISKDDYKFFILAKIGEQGYKDAIRSHRRIRALHAQTTRWDKKGDTETEQVLPTPTESTLEVENQTNGKYADGNLEVNANATSIPVSETNPKLIGLIGLKAPLLFPTGLPFTIPKFEQSHGTAQDDTSSTGTASPNEPEIVIDDTVTAAILHFINSPMMPNFAYLYPAMWEVLHKHIIRKIGRSQYDTAVINRLYTVTEELSRAQ